MGITESELGVLKGVVESAAKAVATSVLGMVIVVDDGRLIQAARRQIARKDMEVGK